MAKMKALAHIVGAGVLGAALLLGAGCAAQTAASPAAPSSAAAQEEPSSAAAEAVLVLGPQEEGSVTCFFTNGTGASITDIAVTAPGTADDPVFLIENGQTIAPDEAFSVSQQPVDGSAVFDVVVSIADDSYTLHDVDFRETPEAVIRLDGSVAYIEFQADGAVASTLQEETALAEAAAQAAAEQAAAEQAAAEQAAQTPAPPAPAPAAQSQDQCVGDVVLR